MRRAVAIAVGLAAAAPAGAWAQQGDDEEEVTDEEEGEDEGGDEESGDEEGADEEGDATPKPAPAEPAKQGEFKKQDLRGHAVEADRISNPFQKDRFFVDKVDTEKTAKGTLVQGSLQWSNFVYRESGGALNNDPVQGSSASRFNRYFTDFRLQTDFRHLGGSKWDARIDTRGRLVNNPADGIGGLAAPASVDDARVQSGFNGQNEAEVREAWIVRSGKRSDIFFGRQFITDLGALKIDGLRVDYAKSEKLTLLGFGGLYPLRGSRSLTTDYQPLQTNDGAMLSPAGRLVTAGGFGAAYRTVNMHGALGGVALVPLSSERPRVYVTSNGYYRSGSALDLYHFAIIDLVGSAGFSLTNLSAGANYKPNQRLRLTASFNRVDTETLNVQAGIYLKDPVTEGGAVKVQNETYLQLQRVSTNAARASASAGLGHLQRFEVTIASAYRYRPDLTLRAPDGTTNIALAAAKGVDVFGSVMDRRSLFGLRVGVDVSKSFGLGNVAFQRSEVLATRLFAAREIGEGRGEWEGEVSYSTSLDRAGGSGCTGTATSPADCFGTSKAKIMSGGANVYYRIRGNLFGLGSLFVSRMNLQRLDGMTVTADPAVTSVTGFLRVAYRF
ncbi:MAG: hypothetical protein H0X17_02790 [Deltaproteobacteria bacterium]|nr:hypothetical protein [Deltaproteobacteria bacterium]